MSNTTTNDIPQPGSERRSSPTGFFRSLFAKSNEVEQLRSENDMLKRTLSWAKDRDDRQQREINNLRDELAATTAVLDAVKLTPKPARKPRTSVTPPATVIDDEL